MKIQYAKPLPAFVLAGVAAMASGVLWLISLGEAVQVSAVCHDHFGFFAALADCRWPSVYGAIAWILLTGAIASAWVGGVRISRNKNAGERRANKDAPPPHDAHPST
jgi:hypothetical protein